MQHMYCSRKLNQILQIDIADLLSITSAFVLDWESIIRQKRLQRIFTQRYVCRLFCASNKSHTNSELVNNWVNRCCKPVSHWATRYVKLDLLSSVNKLQSRNIALEVSTALCKARTTITCDVASCKHMARIYIRLDSGKDMDTLSYVPHT